MKEIIQLRSSNSELKHVIWVESLLVVVTRDLKMNLIDTRNKLPGINLRVWGSFLKEGLKIKGSPCLHIGVSQSMTTCTFREFQCYGRQNSSTKIISYSQQT